MTHTNFHKQQGRGPDQPMLGAFSVTDPMDRIVVRAFRAIDDPVRCLEYVNQHTKVLEDIGVFTALQPGLSWCMDPSVTVLVAEHEQLGMVAGIRIHKATYGSHLPMQHCMSVLDPSISARLASLLPNGNAEIAGLWNAHRFSGRGIPKLLMESAVATASQLGVYSLVTFIAEYVAPYATRSGFQLMADLRQGGVFAYPVPHIRTHAMILPDVLTISRAASEDRQRIVSLRLRTHQVRVERPKSSEIMVQYALLEPTPSTDEVAGRSSNAA